MERRTRFGIMTAALLVVGLVAGSVPTTAQVALDQPPQSCDDPSRSIGLVADEIGKRKIGYGLAGEKPSVPGPTIAMEEGECVAITLVNDSRRTLSFHPHGVAYSVASDGTSINRGCVAPGRSRTYVVSAPPQMTRTDGTVDPGTAGYWHYHDHCLGTIHGTGGIDRGLFGAIVVRRAGDPRPARDPFVVVFKDTTVNLKRAPRTPIFRAALGQRVEFVVITHGDEFHTFHLHGHRWADTRTGNAAGLSDPTPIIDNKTVGPADSFGFQVVAGEHVGEGAWMYHCHVQGHSDLGMVGLFAVGNENGELSNQTKAAIKRWKRQEGGHH